MQTRCLHCLSRSPRPSSGGEAWPEPAIPSLHPGEAWPAVLTAGGLWQAAQNLVKLKQVESTIFESPSSPRLALYVRPSFM